LSEQVLDTHGRVEVSQEQRHRLDWLGLIVNQHHGREQPVIRWAYLADPRRG
jgi:hypothetical protein